MSTRSRWLAMGLVGAVAVAGVVAVLAVGSGGSGSGAGCKTSVDALARHIRSRTLSIPALDPAKVKASLQDCSSADAWRSQAQRDGIGPTLGRLLHDPSLEADRALSALCAHFDAYTVTAPCKGAPSGP